jgi:hypothetical protein
MDMYLVGRNRAVNPANPRAAVAAAIEVGQRAGQVIDRPVYTWSTIFGPEPLTVMWTARVEHLAEIVAADDALAADDAFNELAEQHNDLFASPLVGVVSQVVHGAPTGGPKAYISVTRAVAANGTFGEAMATGVELADTLTRLTGHETMFITAVTGEYGGVAWIVGSDDLGEVEAANATLAASDEWLKLVDRAGHCYAPGASTTMMRRLA